MAWNAEEHARALESKKRYLDAASCWLTAGQIEKAIANYERGGHARRAIALAREAGLNLRAAELYLKLRLYGEAAEIYRQERDFSRAARALRQAGRIAEAADLFEQAGELTEAARLHESINDFRRAGELYENGGDLTSSARVRQSLGDGDGVSLPAGKQEMARVAQLLTRVLSFESTAEALQAEEVSEAILSFTRMGEVESAARLLAQCRRDVGTEVLRRIDETNEPPLQFARMFYLARDYGRAARVFEKSGEGEKAAYLYAKDGDYSGAARAYARCGRAVEAAEMFEKAGSHREAAQAYLQAGHPLRAADCFAALDDHARAGRLYHENRRPDLALVHLQQVKPDDPAWAEVSAMVADVLHLKGHEALAIRYYRTALGETGVTETTVDSGYKLGCLLAEVGSLYEAEKLFGSIVGLRPDHRDAARRFDELRRLRAAATGTADPVLPPRLSSPDPRRAAPAVPLPPSNHISPQPGAAAAPEALLDPPVQVHSRAPTLLMSAPTELVSRMEGYEVLVGTPLFADLSRTEMKRIWKMCETRRAGPGEVILEQGIDGPGLFIIQEGVVNVVKGEELVVQLYSGAFFGEMSLIDPGALTSARIVAERPTDLLFLDRSAFDRLLASDDHTALKMYRAFVSTLCERLRRATDEVVELRSCR